jgi:hypothetical protein
MAVRQLLGVGCALALLVLAGCIPSSINPFYTDDDVVFEPALIGVWSEQDSKATYEFIRTDSNMYTMSGVDEEGKNFALEARLVKVDGAMYIDLYPDLNEIDISEDYKVNLVPVHTFYYVHHIEPELLLASINEDWLKDYLEAEGKDIPYQIVDDNVVFTGPTSMLRELMADLPNEEGALETPTPFTRLKK